jgi:hypothetical protein
MLEQLHEASPDVVKELLAAMDTEDEEPRTVGPVRLRDADERLAAIPGRGVHAAAAGARQALRSARRLTEKGNLRPAHCYLSWILAVLGIGFSVRAGTVP